MDGEVGSYQKLTIWSYYRLERVSKQSFSLFAKLTAACFSDERLRPSSIASMQIQLLCLPVSLSLVVLICPDSSLPRWLDGSLSLSLLPFEAEWEVDRATDVHSKDWLLLV